MLEEEGVSSSATSVSHSQSSSSSSEEEGDEVEEGPGVVKEGVLTAFNLTCTAASVATASTEAREEETAWALVETNSAIEAEADEESSGEASEVVSQVIAPSLHIVPARERSDEVSEIVEGVRKRDETRSSRARKEELTSYATHISATISITQLKSLCASAPEYCLVPSLGQTLRSTFTPRTKRTCFDEFDSVTGMKV